MLPSLLLLIHLAFCNFAYGTLDLGPAHVDVDVFMSLDDRTASMSTEIPTAEPTLDATTQHSESTRSALQPYSKATSYVASVWRGLDGALRDSESSSSNPGSLSVTSATTTDQPARSDASTTRGSQENNAYMPHYLPSSSPTSTDLYTACTVSSSAPTAPSSSCYSLSSGSAQSNTTGTWTWPPIASAWPSPSNHSTNTTPITSPITAQSNANGNSNLGARFWWVAMALVLIAEARSRL